MKHLREYLESRENTWNDPEWIKQYELKAKELQRARNEKIAQSKKKYCYFTSWRIKYLYGYVIIVLT